MIRIYSESLHGILVRTYYYYDSVGGNYIRSEGSKAE